MPVDERTRVVGAALAIAVAAVAVALAWWQVRERSRREDDLDEDDVAHFARQDARRWLVSTVMILLAVGLLVGTRIHPGVRGRPNVAFLRIWIAVGLLVLSLLGLAMLDWVATRFYARRHRDAIHRARLSIFEAEIRRRARIRDANGHHDAIEDDES